MTTPRAEAPSRADARRNHERVLAAAREVFTRDGVAASLNDIARRAGVGPATLYRHFPTREALLTALLADRYADLADRAQELPTTSEIRTALVSWLRAFIDHVVTFRGLAAPVKAALADERSELFAACHAMRSAWDELVAQARRADALHPTVQSTDLLRLANALAWATEDLPDNVTEAKRLLDVALSGFAPHQAHDH